MVIINLIVDTIAPSFDTLQICNGDSAWIGGIYVYSAGNYNDTLVNSAGCDSVVQVSVVVNDVYTTFDTLSICANDSANINGSYFFVTGLYTDTLASLSGCDSIVYTTLFVDPIFEFTDTVNICAGDSIQLGNNYYHNSGLYTDSLVTTLGCDSIISTLVIVDSASSLTDSMTICAGDSIFFAGAYVSTTGQYVDSLQNSVGCDSLIYFNLTVEPIIVTQDTIDICAGDSVFIGGGYQFTTGLYEDTLTAQDGCDSIIVTALNVNSTYQIYDTLELCYGDSILIGGAYQSIDGIYYDSLISSSGCDSINITTLIIKPEIISLDTTELCAGDSLFVGGAYQNSSGVYYDTLTSLAGCDSIIQTTITIINTLVTNDTLEICAGDSLFIGGQYHDSAGLYFDTLSTVQGCDSVLATFLMVNPITVYSDSMFICSGDSIFVGGAFQYNTGLYFDTLTSANGCDSILETYLQVDSVLYSYDSIALCSGDSVLIGGNYQSTGGIYRDTLVALGGCDSVIVTQLTINQDYYIVDTVSICTGDSILLDGGYQYASGVYYDSLQSISGCDSILETHLKVDTVLFGYDTVQICSGDSALISGNYYSISGVHYDSLNALAGCDSIQVTYIQVLPVLQTIDTISICAGDSLFVGGNYQTSSGLFIDTLTSAIGCDSIISTHLLIDSIAYTQDSINLCYGDSIIIGGVYQSVPGLYNDTLSNMNGCDSVVSVQLYIDTIITSSDSVSICSGDSILIGGLYQYSSGIYLSLIHI